jgi:hypothetical protein
MGTASDPSAFITQISTLIRLTGTPRSFLMNEAEVTASLLPSGDHLGLLHPVSGLETSGFASELSAFITHIL